MKYQTAPIPKGYVKLKGGIVLQEGDMWLTPKGNMVPSGRIGLRTPHPRLMLNFNGVIGCNIRPVEGSK